MIYNIVDGLSKLLCDPLPYLKTKKNDLITTYAKRGTTTVHYLKLICDRRCTTMSFVYFLMFELLIWIIKDIEWRKVNEKSCTTRPIIFVEDSVDSRPFVLQFAKKFLSNYYSLSFKERNVLVLILCCYLYYYLP